MMGERDFDVLGDLDAAVRNYVGIGAGKWVRPLDCGGSNGSDHSYRLSKLCRLGLAEQRVRRSGERGSKLYTITDAGLAALKKEGQG